MTEPADEGVAAGADGPAPLAHQESDQAPAASGETVAESELRGRDGPPSADAGAAHESAHESQPAELESPESDAVEAAAGSSGESSDVPWPAADLPAVIDESWPEWPALEGDVAARQASEVPARVDETLDDLAPPRRWADLVKRFDSAAAKATAEVTPEPADVPIPSAEIRTPRRAEEPPMEAELEELHETRSPAGARPLLSVPETVQAICPYLQVDGGWRYAIPSRDHRCTAVAPALALTPEKQRRLCLTSDHHTCSTYLAALAVRATGQAALPGATELADGRPLREGALSDAPLGDAPLGEALESRWGFTRTTPVILDPARRSISLPGVGGRLGGGQLALAGVLVVAFVGIAVARLQDGRTVTTGGLSPAVSPSPAATTAPLPAASPLFSTSPEPSPTATPSPSRSASPTPRPTQVALRTYRVQKGDTLYGVARKFGTTVKILQQLNGLGSSTVIHVGQVLKLP